MTVHASPVAPFWTGGGCLTVPSSSQLMAAGFDDVVMSTTTAVVALDTTYGAA